MDFGMCKNDWSGPEYNHPDREQHGKLEDSVDNKLGGTWHSRHQRKDLSRIFIIIITVCDHHDTTVTDSKDARSITYSLWFMDDVKLYGKNSSQIDSLV